MLPRLGRVFVQPTRNANFRSIIQASQSSLKRAAVAPALATRAFTIQTAKRAYTIDAEATKDHAMHSTSSKSTSTPQSLFDTLEECKSTGNLKGAIKAVQQAQEKGLASPKLYLALVDMLRDSPFDVNECATVAHWFYSPDSKLPLDVLEDINIWKSVLKLGFRFGSTYRSEDLRALLDRFTEIFDLTTMNDQTAWELLMRAYGIMNKKDAVSACIQKNEGSQVGKASFYSSALLSYAATNSHDKVENLVDMLQQKGSLSRHTLLKLIRCYGFKGDIEHATQYTDMCNKLNPNQKCDKTMLLIAHKIALQKMCDRLAEVRGARGLSLKPADSTQLNELHASWENLTKDMFAANKDAPVDITDCNVVLEYLTTANRIDPVGFPMEKAEEIFESYMPANYITPNDASHRIMLVGYATSQQYNDHHRNIRLDKALEMVSKMQVAGLDTLNHPTFHSLFRACLPHRDGHYYFDNFRLNSLLPARPYTHNRFKLDPRIFEIEKIMLEAKLPHDRFTFTTLMTCLASGGQYKALRTRWRSLKVHGLRRDVGMYRLTYALASLNPTQAKRAIVVVRNEMNREIPKERMDWDTYTAMLDCCATAQMPFEAKDIIKEMRHATELVHRSKTHADDLAKWPYTDEPNFYLPMLRAAITVPGLDANSLLKEMDKKDIKYNQGVWEAVLSKLAMEGDEQGIRQLFNKYTMTRFENEGKIPVPVRESKPVVPFPTAPYNQLDMKFIDVYICSLLDSQDVSLVFDVLRTLSNQTNDIGISRQTLQGVVRLAKQEKSTDELKWLRDEILPKVTHQNKFLRVLKRGIDNVIN
ncbi:hypothetical protein MAM1_0113c05630 [Mucor ambiguus]|uniref:Pentatricopeptide repeat-containing protein n=1 Tax=Mucor ambiguus TaxID=91626 RepID=A0A0C9MS45_9FUNG|nr:hypothetical protein MAM1_0113c05630 [Mucor ambiguus]